MGFFSQAFGLSGGNGGGDDRPADLPRPRKRHIPKTEKEALKEHLKEQEEALNKDEPRDGKLW